MESSDKEIMKPSCKCDGCGKLTDQEKYFNKGEKTLQLCPDCSRKKEGFSFRCRCPSCGIPVEGYTLEDKYVQCPNCTSQCENRFGKLYLVS